MHFHISYFTFTTYLQRIHNVRYRHRTNVALNIVLVCSSFSFVGIRSSTHGIFVVVKKGSGKRDLEKGRSEGRSEKGRSEKGI